MDQATSLLFPGALALALFEAAESTARKTAARIRHARRRRVGETLRPGPETPLWNELQRQLAPHLKPYGTKAQLARFLGVSPQRLRVCLKARQACLDGERTLLLLCWLAARQQGRSLGW